MSKSSFFKGVLVGAGCVIGLLMLFFFAMPYLYLHSENSNFAKLRKKSELNCETMPLHCLVQEGNIKGLSEYVENSKNLELKDNWGKTALYWALTNGKHDIVNLLLASKANPNTTDENGMSVFYQAVISGKYNVADQLLASGANIDAFNGSRYPETLLHYCVMKNNMECVSYLLEHGANKSLKDSFGYTVFERIRMHNHISREIGELLVK
jgi:ankyrin repeat protein